MTKSMKNADDYLERNSGQKKAAQTVMKTTSYKTDNTGELMLTPSARDRHYVRTIRQSHAHLTPRALSYSI